VKQVTRDAILAAGEAVFSERGFGGARMEDIAERAGVSVGTLYNYFDDRDALLEAILEASAHALTARMVNGLPPASEPFAQQVERFFALALQELETRFRLYAALVDEDPPGRKGKHRRPPLLRALLAAAEKLVAGGVQAGALRPADAPLYPALLVGMMRGIFMRQLWAEDRRPLTSQAGPMARFFLAGAGRSAP
jgi:AcrR family transcriptional regulator